MKFVDIVGPRQEQLRERAKQLRDVTEDRVRVLRDDLGTRMESVKGVVDQGRQAASDARADLEDKLERSKAAYRAGLEAAREVVDGDAPAPGETEPAEVES